MGVHSGPKILAEDYTIRVFTSSGTFTPSFTGTVEVLVVGGGGAGGGGIGGGGGGGGVVHMPAVSVTASTAYTITVGAGGAAIVYSSTSGSGGDSTAFGATAKGGGGSGVHDSGDGVAGGSGGGAASNNGRINRGGASTGNSLGSNSGTIYGNRGGNMIFARITTPTAAAGGGGAGSTATDTNSNSVQTSAGNANGRGGAGIPNSILGTEYYWAGGGGGGAYYNGYAGNGGIGGGGAGSCTGGSGPSIGGSALNSGSNAAPDGNGGAGGVNTGGGGGGGAWQVTSGGAGGSGIVIIRYSSSLGTSTGGSSLRPSLKFMLDTNNTQKSWKGPPVTNLVPNPYANWNGSNFVFPIYNYDETNTHTFTYVTGVPNPVGAPGVMQYSTGTTGYKYWSIYSTIATTGTHTFSYYARIVGGPAATSSLSNTQLWRANGVDQSVTGNWNPTYTTEWVRYTTTGPGTGSTPLDYFPIHGGAIVGGYTIQYCGFQLELGTYATPFVVGTRSNTQAILDLTRQNTVTVNNLTYSDTGSFRFDGTDDYISVPVPTGRTRTVCITYKLNSPGAGWGPLWRSDDWKERIFPGTITIINSNGTYYELAGPNSTTNIIHIAYSYNERNAKSYRNGILQSNITMDGPMDIGNFTYNFGRQAGGSTTAFVDMELYNVQFYDMQLTDDQVLQNFNAAKLRFGI